ncbi:MAG: TfoX/Sxy family protein [Candidatus Humimicrobiaceae bacterium]
MKWIKASEKPLIETFDKIIPNLPGVEKRKMFGYPVTFIRGNMFIGVHGDSMILRLPEAKMQHSRKVIYYDGYR